MDKNLNPCITWSTGLSTPFYQNELHPPNNLECDVDLQYYPSNTTYAQWDYWTKPLAVASTSTTSPQDCLLLDTINDFDSSFTLEPLSPPFNKLHSLLLPLAAPPLHSTLPNTLSALSALPSYCFPLRFGAVSLSKKRKL
jgi:hypothetical protein